MINPGRQPKAQAPKCDLAMSITQPMSQRVSRRAIPSTRTFHLNEAPGVGAAPSQIRATFLIGEHRMDRVMKSRLAPTCGPFAVVLGLAVAISPAIAVRANSPRLILAQAMLPPTGMMDAQHPMPMNERMLRRFPQPVRVGDLIGLPVLDQDASTRPAGRAHAAGQHRAYRLL
jgi:hypothetical protein